jgi:hypothetical protein
VIDARTTSDAGVYLFARVCARVCRKFVLRTVIFYRSLDSLLPMTTAASQRVRLKRLMSPVECTMLPSFCSRDATASRHNENMNGGDRPRPPHPRETDADVSSASLRRQVYAPLDSKALRAGPYYGPVLWAHSGYVECTRPGPSGEWRKLRRMRNFPLAGPKRFCRPWPAAAAGAMRFALLSHSLITSPSIGPSMCRGNAPRPAAV